MNRKETALFIGHSNASIEINLVMCEIVKLIEKGVNTFLNGYMGTFDAICARAVKELKNQYPDIKSYYITPYLNSKQDINNFFDESIYPELENCPYAVAIPRRNLWMVNHSSYAICYIEHEWGGAATTYRHAVKKNLTIINLGKKKINFT